MTIESAFVPHGTCKPKKREPTSDRLFGRWIWGCSGDFLPTMTVNDALTINIQPRVRIANRMLSKRSLLVIQWLCCSNSMDFFLSGKGYGGGVGPQLVSSYRPSFLLMMGSRRSTKRSDLKKKLLGDDIVSSPSKCDNTNSNNSFNNVSSRKSLNQGKGQEIMGVTLPSQDKEIKGWVVGEDNQRVACANVNGKYYAVQGECPRCAFDLYRGKVVNVERSKDPHVACPTCGATFSLRTGKRGPVIANDGFLSGFVNNLAKSATIGNSSKDAKAFIISVDTEKKVYYKEAS